MLRQIPRKPITLRRLKNQILNVLCNPFNLIVLISLVILIYLVAYPLADVLKTTFTLAKAESRRVGGDVGEFTLYYWQYIFASKLSSAVLWKPLGHSLLISFFTCIIAVPFGSALAWLMVRSDLPGKKLFSFLIMIPYMIPSWCKSMAWLAVFRNSRGGSPGFLAGLGVNVPDWLAYGPVAIIVVMTMHYYAYSYIMVSGTLHSINSELEEMGEIQGANKFQIIRSITLPLVLPAVLSGLIMTLSKSLGAYGVPANLGVRIGYYTLSTRMYDALGSGTKGVGYAMALLMVVMASGCIFANRAITGTRKSYATIGGKGGRSNLLHLGKAKTPLTLFLSVFLIVALFVPMFILVMESFQITTGGGYGLNNMTLYNWIGTLDQATTNVNFPGVFKNPDFTKALWNTVRLTVIASLITAFFGQFFGYVSTRGRGKWYGSLTEQLVFIPYLIPSIAFGAIFLGMFSVPHGIIPSLYGTFTLVVLVSVVKHFPFASRSGMANMMQINVELEEAADIAGASFWRRLAKIVLPLSKNGFLSGMMLVFITIAKELDVIALLMTPSTRTLSYLAFVYSADALPQMADAISICMVVFIMLSYLIANKVFKADISKSMG
ncbi:MAG: iron ABC transporter permease [Clostridiales bacterium]|nr:iron ABC transporter permease [Clostridiales bacterium]